MSTVHDDFLALKQEYTECISPVNTYDVLKGNTFNDSDSDKIKFLIVKRKKDGKLIKIYNKDRDLYNDRDYNVSSKEEALTLYDLEEIHQTPYMLLFKCGFEEKEIFEKLDVMKKTINDKLTKNLKPLIKKSDRFPEICLETDTFIGVEWLYGDGWHSCDPRDFVCKAVNITPTVTLTSEKDFMRSVYTELMDIFTSKKLRLSKQYKEIYNDMYNIGEVGSKQISTKPNHIQTQMTEYYASELAKAIVVKKSGGKITDWKFVQLQSLTLSPDGYIIFDSLEMPASLDG